MGNTITQLVTKMLFAENIVKRMSISRQILKLLKKPALGANGIAAVVKAHFTSRIKACAIHPSSSHQKSIIEIAKFYDAHCEEENPKQLSDAA